MSFQRALDLATALQAYNARLKSDRTGKLRDLLESSGLRKGSFDKLFPAMFSLHGLDIAEALNKAIKSKDITPVAAQYATKGINAAMHKMASTYPVMTTEVFNKVNTVLQQFVDAFNENGADTVDSIKVKNMSVHLAELKRIFNQPYIVAYFEGDEKRVASLKIAHNSFANLRDIVNQKIKKEIEVALVSGKVTNSKLTDSNYLTTKIINWGHTKADDSIISGKILAEMMSARNALKEASSDTDVFKVIVEDFLEQTGQQKNIIKVHHGELTAGDPNVLSLILSSGLFQTVIVQNRRENQEDLGQLEKQWSLLDAVGRKNLLKAFKVSSIRDLALMMIRIKSSPSVVDNIENIIVSAIKGIKPNKTKKTTTLLNSTNKIVKRRKKISVVAKRVSKTAKEDPGIVTRTGVDLSSILLNLNASLTDQVKRNMGNGNRNDVLNLRSGRFAESVKVEKLSESREGMITAFYTYMKNPYATFSAGGRQELPRSRDPKLLISKSIREIVQEQIAARMRAVLV